MMWEEWAIVFSPLGKKLFCFPMEPPAILSMSTILEFLPEALTPALGYHIRRTTVFKISSDTTIQFSSFHFSSVQFSCSVMSNSLWPRGLQHARPPCPSPTPRVYSDSCPPCQWCHPAISSSVVPFSSCPQSLPASGSFPMSQLFKSSSQRIAVSVSTSVFPMNIQDWSPLGWTGFISLQSKGVSRVFFNTTVQKHQFFSAQLSL